MQVVRHLALTLRGLESPRVGLRPPKARATDLGEHQLGVGPTIVSPALAGWQVAEGRYEQDFHVKLRSLRKERCEESEQSS